MRVTTLGVSSEIPALASWGSITVVTMPPATVPTALVSACRLDNSGEKASACRKRTDASRPTARRNDIAICLWLLELYLALCVCYNTYPCRSGSLLINLLSSCIHDSTLYYYSTSDSSFDWMHFDTHKDAVSKQSSLTKNQKINQYYIRDMTESNYHVSGF
jgi:hypothetical protein